VGRTLSYADSRTGKTTSAAAAALSGKKLRRTNIAAAGGCAAGSAWLFYAVPFVRPFSLRIECFADPTNALV
jgi:hypothetical protein